MSTEGECVASHGIDKDGEPRTARATHGRLCKNHSHRLAEWLRDVAVDYALLDTRLAPSQSHEERRSKGDAAAAPANLTVIALRDAERFGGAPRERGDELWYELPDIPSVLATIHAQAEELRALLDPTHEPDSDVRDVNLTREVQFLLDAYPTLTAASFVGDTFREVKALWIALQRAHDRPKPAPVGPCLNVDCTGTVWPRPDARPWCSKCKRVYETDADIIKVGIEAEKARKRRRPA